MTERKRNPEDDAVRVTVGDDTVVVTPSDRPGTWRFRGKIRVGGRAVRATVSFVEAQPRDAGPETFAHISHAEHVDTLRAAPVVAARVNKGGTALSFRLDLSGRKRALFKPDQRNSWTVPRKEVAAYRIDRALGLNAVPPCTLRRISREELVTKLGPGNDALIARIDRETLFDARGDVAGSAALWLSDTVESGLDTLEAVRRWGGWLAKGGTIESGEEDVAAQLSSMLLFDRVIDNVDRFSGGAILETPDGDSLFWIDNSMAFTVDPVGNRRCQAYLSRCQRFRKSVIESLRHLDEERLGRVLAAEQELLTSEERDALLRRVDVVLAYVDELVRCFGEDEVLPFA